MLTFIAICASTMVKAQSQEESTQQLNVPESYNQTQNQVASDLPAGSSTYNIAENETPAADPGAAAWRDESDTEVLRVYSGAQEGNNVIKTIEVKKAANPQGSSYTPH